jgi:RNA polymerase sigma-70 factor (ECF subfamily)
MPDDITKEAAWILAELLHKRDPAALKYLSQFSGYLSQVISFRFPFLEKEDVDDIVMDGILRTFQRGEKFAPQLSSIKTWLVQNTIFVALDQIRAQRLRTVPIEEAEELAAPLETITEENYSASSRLLEYMKRLPFKQEQVIKMRYLDGLPDSEIAKHLNVAESSVRVTRMRALRKLRQMITDEEKVDVTMDVNDTLEAREQHEG